MKLRYYIGSLILIVYGFLVVSTMIRCHHLYSRALKEDRLTVKVKMLQSQPGYLRLEEIPGPYIQSIIQIEDQRFYQHHGLDYLMILQDLNPLKKMNHRSITEQVVQNLVVIEEEGVAGHIAKWMLAKQLEGWCSKQEILELYINTQYFGNGYYGLEKASEGYFNKEAKDLSNKECLRLLALQKDPLDEAKGMKQVESRLSTSNSSWKKLEDWLYNFGIRWLKDMADYS